MSQYLTPADLKAALTTFNGQGVDFTTLLDPALTSLIQQASAKIDAELDLTDEAGLGLVRKSEHYRGDGTNFLRLRNWPIWGGLQTTLAANALATDNSVTLTSVAGLLPGHVLLLGPGGGVSASVGVGYTPPALGVTPLSPVVVPLAAPLGSALPAGTACVVGGIDSVTIQLLAGEMWPIPVSTLIIENELGTVQNWTPMMFQSYGTTTVFPKGMPLLVTYTYGFPYPFPPALRQVCLELCIQGVQAAASQIFSGLQSIKSGDEERRYAQLTRTTLVPGEITPNQSRRLTQFRRDIGVF